MQNKVDMNNTRKRDHHLRDAHHGFGGAVLFRQLRSSQASVSAVIGVILNLVLPKKLEEEKTEE